MASVVDLALEDDRLRELGKRLSEGSEGAGTAIPASAPLRPVLVAALTAEQEAYGSKPVLVVTPDDRSARDFAAALAAYVRDRKVRYYPSRGTGYSSHVSPPPHLVGLRIDALDSLLDGSGGDGRPPIVVAGAIALAETVPDASLRPHGFSIELGEEIDLTETASKLAAAGYERVDQVSERGQFALRGGILDIFAATEERAARIELFGDEVESMRWFSTFTQRSLGDAERLEIAPAAELDVEHRELAELALMEAEEAAQAAGTNAAGAGQENGSAPAAALGPRLGEVLPIDSFHAPLDLIPPETAIVLTAPEEIEPTLKDHWEDVTLSIHDEDARSLYVDVADPLRSRASLMLVSSGAPDAEPSADLDPETEPDEGEPALAFRASRAESPARNMREAEAELDKLVRSGYRVVVAFDGAGEAERTRYNLDRLDARLIGRDDVVAPRPGVSFAEARLTEGLIWPGPRLAIFPIRRLVHRRAQRPEPALGVGTSRARLAFTDLKVGDYVVHEDHGVARFAGFETREVAGITRDYLYLEYKGEDRVYVPTEQLAKLSRYVGAGEAPTLSALGGKRWQNLKARARRAASEMAGELLNLYAERRTRKGHAFSPDSEWQIQMEAAFPYRETADQMDAIEAVKADMESDQPMDRLVCGDVGYGKTEVALRAAVKAASDGMQTIVLVPTTILAQQHFGTFKERLADLPFVVEGVSRLRKPAEVKKAVAAFKEGQVDILIGTHRLLSRDVRAKNLGLVIVDEEQRFGVKQKDLLRQLRLRVDVLSLSATPIPRTLQMSLAGLRDISVIETPPEGRRPVRTFVGGWDEDLVRHAIEREVERGGQAFFLHNRVDTLPEISERLRGLVPNARFVEAHGQMDETELENTMLGFMRGDADVLVATTIIESGLDIPSANTLIVERADQLGLAQAYQIRGRVGRSRERAFAYLLYPSADLLTEEAAARLSALADHTELGSGFRIAMRDLDIRGAGNLLGDEQSGHVAAVGFELYCQMIDEAVAQLQAERAAAEDGAEGEGEPEREPVRLDVPVDAYLPADYVPFEAAKIDVHRRIAAARRGGELRAIRDELHDRFGPPPEPVENLISLQAARIDLGEAGARGIEFRGGRLTITGVKLDSAQAEGLRQAVDGVAYAWREETISIRVDNEAPARLAAVVAIAGALRDVLGQTAERVE